MSEPSPDLLEADEANEGRADGFALTPDGGKIAYQTRGPKTDPNPVLLIRPLGGSMALWGPFREHLGAGRRTIAFDHRGSGYSSEVPSFVTTKGLARDALCVLDHLGVARAQVFGISLGGMTAMWVAILAPERVSRLCLAAAPARGLELSRSLGRELLLAASLLAPSSAMEATLVDRILTRHYRKAHVEELRRIERLANAEPTTRMALAKFASAALLHNARSELSRITAPTLVLAGDHDGLLGTEPPRRLAAAIRGAEFDIIADSGHDLTLEQPEATAARVGRFFELPAG